MGMLPIELISPERISLSGERLYSNYTKLYGRDSISIEFVNSVVLFFYKQLGGELTVEQVFYLDLKIDINQINNTSLYEKHEYFHHIELEVEVSEIFIVRFRVVWPVVNSNLSNPDVSTPSVGVWAFEIINFKPDIYKLLIGTLIDKLQFIRSEDEYKSAVESNLFRIQKKDIDLLKPTKFEVNICWWLVSSLGCDVTDSVFIEYFRRKVRPVIISQLTNGKSKEYRRFILRNLMLTWPTSGLSFPLPVYPDVCEISLSAAPFNAYLIGCTIKISSRTKGRMNLCIGPESIDDIFIDVVPLDIIRINKLYEVWMKERGLVDQ